MNKEIDYPRLIDDSLRKRYSPYFVVYIFVSLFTGAYLSVKISRFIWLSNYSQTE